MSQSSLFTSVTLAKELQISKRHLNSYAAIARESCGFSIDAPTGGYTDEGVAELRRAVGLGGPEAYRKVLIAEAQDKSAANQGAPEVLPLAPAPDAGMGDRPHGAGHLTVLPGGQGRELTPNVGGIVLSMPDGTAIVPPSGPNGAVNVPSGRPPSAASPCALTGVSQGQLDTQAQMQQLQGALKTVTTLANQRLGDLSAQAKQADLNYYVQEAQILEGIQDLEKAIAATEQQSMRQQATAVVRGDRLGKMTDQFTSLASAVGVGVKAQSQPSSESESPQPSASPQQSQD